MNDSRAIAQVLIAFLFVPFSSIILLYRLNTESLSCIHCKRLRESRMSCLCITEIGIYLVTQDGYDNYLYPYLTVASI